MNESNRSATAAALSGPLGDEEAMMHALFGRFARRVPMWMVVQETGNVGVTFVGASRDLRLRFGSTMTHQLILGEMIVRPHVAIESDRYQGLGLSGFLTQCADLEEWFANGRLLCDPIGRFAPGGKPR